MYGLLWIIIGGFFEPAWVISLEKYGKSGSNTKFLWLVAALVLMFCSLYFLSKGMEEIAIGISYAIWTAIGAIVTIVAGRIFYKEGFNWGKILAIILILIGISGLELAGGS